MGVCPASSTTLGPGDVDTLWPFADTVRADALRATSGSGAKLVKNSELPRVARRFLRMTKNRIAMIAPSKTRASTVNVPATAPLFCKNPVLAEETRAVVTGEGDVNV